MIVLTNDDGIDAPGIAALERELAGGEPYVVVATARPMSECSHCVTTSQPFDVHRLGDRRFSVEGTPADCVRVALLHVLPMLGVSPSDDLWVYSGINAGGNLGADIYISGTVAAAREATFHGIPAIAISQYKRAVPDEARWELAARFAREALARARATSLDDHSFWNINLPWVEDFAEMPEVVFCERSRRPLPVKYEETEGALKYVRGLYHLREREPGSDIDVCFSGRIAVSKITL